MNYGKAIVLLSTYNGEKFLRDLLDSIMGQTYKNFELIVRDDGSSDGTIRILKSYKKKYSNISLVLDNNHLGYPDCFYYLLDLVSKEANYYFFADQDDVWESDKIQRAICKLKDYSLDDVVSYYAGYYICDDELNVVGQSHNKREFLNFKESIFEVCGLEFTMAINRGALLFLNSYRPLKVKARGIWMSMLFSACGIVIYDNYYCAYYRRHSSAFTSSNMFGVRLWEWRIKHFFKNNEFNNYHEILVEFYDVCFSVLSEKDKKLLQLFIGKNRFKKMFYFGRLRSRLLDDIALRFVFLLGRL